MHFAHSFSSRFHRSGAGLDDDQEEKLRKVLGQRYHLITREDRLDAVAKDIVHYFLNRGYQGKAMVVSIDKLTTLRMYEKVRAELLGVLLGGHTLMESIANSNPVYGDKVNGLIVDYANDGARTP